MDYVARDLGPTFVQEYRMFELEQATPNRLYCSSSRCATFIPPGSLRGDNAVCGNCRTRTCRHCKSKAHPSKLCTKDRKTEKVKRLGSKEGWELCRGCKHMILRNEWCLHMTCKCGTSFWYHCRKRSVGEVVKGSDLLTSARSDLWKTG